jgi:hypothetical protein
MVSAVLAGAAAVDDDKKLMGEGVESFDQPGVVVADVQRGVDAAARDDADVSATRVSGQTEGDSPGANEVK